MACHGVYYSDPLFTLIREEWVQLQHVEKEHDALDCYDAEHHASSSVMFNSFVDFCRLHKNAEGPIGAEQAQFLHMLMFAVTKLHTRLFGHCECETFWFKRKILASLTGQLCLKLEQCYGFPAYIQYGLFNLLLLMLQACATKR